MSSNQLPTRRSLREAQTTRVRTGHNSFRRVVNVAGTMTVITGFFAALVLPSAYASDYEIEPEAAPKTQVGQTLLLKTESLETSGVATLRDGYDTVSAAELRTQARDRIRQNNVAAYLASGARELGDDYPWATELSMSQGGGISPLRYFVRECVDFVAWRLNRDAGSFGMPFKYDWDSLTPGAGSARSWKSQWERHGWEVSSVPSPGWVAWFPGANHVSYVNSVNSDGTVLIEEYSGEPKVYNQRVIAVSDAVYLSPPPR